mmetsp:Transcript_4746/g.7344  ORF Transcript_4746/g.7344 Transcript_4746/m.7344 type:complete len:84 (+) Transcript_4746:340-591(+)
MIFSRLVHLVNAFINLKTVLSFQLSELPFNHTKQTTMSLVRQKVEEFHVHRIHNPKQVDSLPTPITELIGGNKPTVIHFYNGG